MRECQCQSPSPHTPDPPLINISCAPMGSKKKKKVQKELLKQAAGEAAQVQQQQAPLSFTGLVSQVRGTHMWQLKLPNALTSSSLLAVPGAPGRRCHRRDRHSTSAAVARGAGRCHRRQLVPLARHAGYRPARLAGRAARQAP